MQHSIQLHNRHHSGLTVFLNTSHTTEQNCLEKHKYGSWSPPDKVKIVQCCTQCKAFNKYTATSERLRPQIAGLLSIRDWARSAARVIGRVTGQNQAMADRHWVTQLIKMGKILRQHRMQQSRPGEGLQDKLPLQQRIGWLYQASCKPYTEMYVQKCENAYIQQSWRRMIEPP